LAIDRLFVENDEVLQVVDLHDDLEGEGRGREWGGKRMRMRMRMGMGKG
jgi:hypothetical protein